MADQKPPSDMFVHSPLPYLVTVRSTVDDDAAPQVRILKITAYSIVEAMLQASVECGANTFGDDEKHKIERIEPDAAAFLALALKGELIAPNAAR